MLGLRAWRPPVILPSLLATVRVAGIALLTVGAMLAVLGTLAAFLTTAPWVDGMMLGAILFGLGGVLCFVIVGVVRRARDRWSPPKR